MSSRHDPYNNKDNNNNKYNKNDINNIETSNINDKKMDKENNNNNKIINENNNINEKNINMNNIREKKNKHRKKNFKKDNNNNIKNKPDEIKNETKKQTENININNNTNNNSNENDINKLNKLNEEKINRRMNEKEKLKNSNSNRFDHLKNRKFSGHEFSDHNPHHHHGPRMMGGNQMGSGPNYQQFHNGQPQGQTIYSTNNMNNSWHNGYLGVGYQIMMIFFLIGLIYNCIFGRNLNDKHALAWYNANKQYFEERYELIGVSENENNDLPIDSKSKDCVLIKENPYYYKLCCANYRYIKWLIVSLQFKKRFDATTMLTSLLFAENDKLIFQVAFNPVEPVGWIFCVCKKREVNGVKYNYPDINFFCETIYEPSVMSNRMNLLTENLEVFMELFNNRMLFYYYKEIEIFLDAIYYSDQLQTRDPFTVFFSFDINLTYSGQDRKLLEITHFVNLFVDTLAQLKYSNEFRNNLKQKRLLYERTKMAESKRKEIEEKEKRDFIERWKIINKMKNKKGLERRRLQKELEKYE